MSKGALSTRRCRGTCRLDVGLRDRRGRDGGVELALAQRQEDVGLRLVGAELALAPGLDLVSSAIAS